MSHLRISGLAVLSAIVIWAAASFYAASLYATDGSSWIASRVGLAQDTSQLEEGARLFAENCAVCHGENGQGRVGATLAKNWPSIRPDLRVKTTIQNGIAGTPMIPWSQEKGGPLTNEQIDALVAFILSWETGGPPVIPPTSTFIPRVTYSPVPNVEGDPNNGAVLFSQNCVVCHGEEGQGRVGATLAKNFPSIRPDLQVKTTIANGVAGSPMPAWSQENGGPLTDNEVDDLTAFVLTLPSISQVTQVAPSALPTTPTNPWLTGWGGLILGLVLFVVLIALILWLQRRRKV